ncbi:hypothetical protein ABW21_db0207306 [Orbilia brochopaga]|nr:hypothetical protein ABW21_db0207306 [Drechslerella brochopaga]
MKKHFLYVMALEEFPPNREFWGRNFNGGEVIQLVLKSPHNGMWLPMPMIQSVMLHELAHNKEMNHSHRFHKHRLGYVAELSELKSKGYTGEGFWGRGRSLHPSSDLTADRLIPKEELPEELCGGIYRREKRRKKEPKKKVDYQEQKRRRIIKKFGSLEGNTVGGDEDIRQELEKGKKPKGKPRVAGSARGRDLRAEAALKRFQVQKEEEEEMKEEEQDATESGSEEEDGELVKLEDDDVDFNAMVDEMSAFACGRSEAAGPSTDAFPEIEDEESDQKPTNATASSERGRTDSGWPRDSGDTKDDIRPQRRKKVSSPILISDDEDKLGKSKGKAPSKSKPLVSLNKKGTGSGSMEDAKSREGASTPICSACQVANDPGAKTCIVCANVLRNDVASWRCKSDSCRNSDVEYRNSTDVSYCGVCGSKR